MVSFAITHIISLRGLFLKAGILGFLWLFLPFWIFLAAAFYFYFFPFFQPLRLALPFFLTLVMAAIYRSADPGNVWFSVFIALLFFLILGIKNLIFVNRFMAHQLLVFFLLFLTFLSFFSGFETWRSWTISFFALGVSAIFLLLVKELADYYSPLESHGWKAVDEERAGASQPEFREAKFRRGGSHGLASMLHNVESSRRRTFLTIGLGALFIWQLCLILLFLPLNYFYQTALLFLSAVLLIDILIEHLNNRLDRRKILANFSIFFVFAAVILVSARWGF